MLRKHKFALKPSGTQVWTAIEIEGTINFPDRFKAWLYDLVSGDKVTVEQAKWLQKTLDLIAVCNEFDAELIGGIKLQYRTFEVTE